MFQQNQKSGYALIACILFAVGALAAEQHRDPLLPSNGAAGERSPRSSENNIVTRQRLFSIPFAIETNNQLRAKFNYSYRVTKVVDGRFIKSGTSANDASISSGS